MSLLWIDGFDEIPTSNAENAIDNYLASEGWLFADGIDRGEGRSGGSCIIAGANTDYVSKLIDPSGSLIVGFGFKFTGSQSTTDLFQIYNDHSPSPEFLWALTRDEVNGISARNASGATESTAPGTLTQDRWAYIEVSLSAAGAFIVRVNNVQVGSGTLGLGAANEGTAIGQIRLVSANSQNHFFDDVVIMDSSGVRNNAFIGDCFVQNLIINGDASPIEFSPQGSVINYQNVDEVGTANDANYNAASVVGATDMFTLSNLSLVTDQVFGVQLGARLRKFGAGGATARVQYRDGPGGVLQDGTEISPDVDFITYFETLDSVPGTSDAWTPAKVNDLEVGYKIES